MLSPFMHLCRLISLLTQLDRAEDGEVLRPRVAAKRNEATKVKRKPRENANESHREKSPEAY